MNPYEGTRTVVSKELSVRHAIILTKHLHASSKARCNSWDAAAQRVLCMDSAPSAVPQYSQISLQRYGFSVGLNRFRQIIVKTNIVSLAYIRLYIRFYMIKEVFSKEFYKTLLLRP